MANNKRSKPYDDSPYVIYAVDGIRLSAGILVLFFLTYFCLFPCSVSRSNRCMRIFSCHR